MHPRVILTTKLAAGAASLTAFALAAGFLFTTGWLFDFLGGTSLPAYHERYLGLLAACWAVAAVLLFVASSRDESRDGGVYVLCGLGLLMTFVMGATATMHKTGSLSRLHEIASAAATIERASPDSPVAAVLRQAAENPRAFDRAAGVLAALRASDAELGLPALERAVVAAKYRDIDPRVGEVVQRVRREGVMTRDDRVLIVTAVLDAPPEAVAHLDTAALVASLER